MQVMLKVVGGKHNGREIKLTGPEFVIGRGEGSHLRPSSDLVSREHCRISVDKGEVTIEDLGSRNGTYVNGERLTELHKARSGDTLRVGRLQFELVLDPARTAKKNKVGSVVEAAARTAESKAEGIEDSITDWLSVDSGNTSGSRTETIRFNIDETQSIKKPSKEIDQSASSSEILEPESKERKKKQKPGKLPDQVKKKSSGNSKSAADEALKNFFNRR